MVLEVPLFMQGNTYAARRLRELVGFIFDVEGVVKPETNALKVGPRAAGATMSIDIAAGTCAIRGDDQAGQGMYLCPSTEVVNRPIGAAPGSGSRIDLVYAQLRDATVTGGTASDWVIEVLPGDAVASDPVPKPVPPSAIPLAEVLVTSTTTSITGGITDRRPTASSSAYVAKAGGDTITASAATVIPLVVKGASGQTANTFEARRDDGTLGIRVNSVGSTELLHGVAARGSSSFANASILASPNAATEMGLVVKGAASQTANLAEFQNSAGTVLLAVQADGGMRINSNTDAIALGAYAGRWYVNIGGTTRVIPFYAV